MVIASIDQDHIHIAGLQCTSGSNSRKPSSNDHDALSFGAGRSDKRHMIEAGRPASCTDLRLTMFQYFVDHVSLIQLVATPT